MARHQTLLTSANTTSKTPQSLTPEQRAFAAALGDVLAQLWIRSRDQFSHMPADRNSQEGEGPPISALCVNRQSWPKDNRETNDEHSSAK